jgi:ABC-type uncharacterized transport system ATPase subunit
MNNPIPTTEKLLRNLSGGNVRKSVLAREFSSGTPRLLIAATLFLPPTP